MGAQQRTLLTRGKRAIVSAALSIEVVGMIGEAAKPNVAPGRGLSRSRSSFFFAAHVLLLVVVLLGFSPSFYLRSVFHHVAQLPAMLYVHGGVLTLWFVLTVLQAWLIQAQRLRFHRPLGYVAAGYAAIVVLVGILANLRLISEIDSPADGENIVIWGNFFTLVMFVLGDGVI